MKYGIFFKKKKKKRVYTVVDRETKEIIDFEIGSRSTATFKRLWKRIKSIECEQYFSDAWHAYRKVLPGHKHTITKKETYTVESKNSQIRAYGSVFHRKTKCVSKSELGIYNKMLLTSIKINEIAKKKKNKLNN